METKIFDWAAYADLARTVAAEGCVLLKNENQVLPISANTKIALFGRSQFQYYKSGTGSGGLVNAPYVTGILDAFKEAEEAKEISLDHTLEAVYLEWLKDHPFVKGEGWASEPWNQEEMPITKQLAEEAAARTDLAVVVIGRTAGEDQDNSNTPGSYLLTADETEMLHQVRSAFDRMVVVLNVGNIIDMNWMQQYEPDAVLYGWQGGMEGGSATVDILLGKINPSGKLADTIAYSIEDYPSTANFGDPRETIYAEDIYMGYRYFETFAKEKVMYPFGFGLSYTTFKVEPIALEQQGDTILLSAGICNTGSVSGKEVLQIYVEKPQGKLGNPARELVGFGKTDLLEPGDSVVLMRSVSKDLLASYDDSGKTGHKSAFVTEPGIYRFYVGSDVRTAAYAGCIEIKELVINEQLEEAMAPIQAFDRMVPVLQEDGSLGIAYEPAPLRTIDIQERILSRRPADRPCTGDLGYKLQDVRCGKVDLETYLDQLSDYDLICMSRGEGMCSPKVTPGIASAFGGVTDRLKAFGMPVAGCSDGPSGIRMDCGALAFSMPNGTNLACTFNTELMEALYEMEGKDLRRNKIDTLLGPGINMHRSPLNGRNFEYFSEDPLLTGEMAAAQLRGMAAMGVTGTIKHFAGNEQEHNRYAVNSVVSERALRQIYLKPFEIAVKEGGAYSVMTTYGSLNGLWTAGSYDLNTTILRKQWGFTGVVMTDWWAAINEEGQEASKENTAPMIRAQNDVYMVVSDSFTNAGNDNAEEALAEGRITRGELLRNAANICYFLMKSPVMDRFLGNKETWKAINQKGGDTSEVTSEETFDYVDGTVIDLSYINTERGTCAIIDLNTTVKGFYRMIFSMSSDASEIAQMPMNVFFGPKLLGTISIHGNGGKIEEHELPLVAEVTMSNRVKLSFGQSGIKLHNMRIVLDEISTKA